MKRILIKCPATPHPTHLSPPKAAATATPGPEDGMELVRFTHDIRSQKSLEKPHRKGSGTDAPLKPESRPGNR